MNSNGDIENSETTWEMDVVNHYVNVVRAAESHYLRGRNSIYLRDQNHQWVCSTEQLTNEVAAALRWRFPHEGWTCLAKGLSTEERTRTDRTT